MFCKRGTFEDGRLSVPFDLEWNSGNRAVSSFPIQLLSIVPSSLGGGSQSNRLAAESVCAAEVPCVKTAPPPPPCGFSPLALLSSMSRSRHRGSGLVAKMNRRLSAPGTTFFLLIGKQTDDTRTETQSGGHPRYGSRGALQLRRVDQLGCQGGPFAQGDPGI
ncbi:hypothetical protein VTK73DRAFT_1816 [Phialemonium thermophilum]|uniref:Uncharacterized protein n=1 Tax=Phialemonium thermophilum TaxID=223376 RepID=A0ABR3VSZ8_9PEZI